MFSYVMHQPESCQKSSESLPLYTSNAKPTPCFLCCFLVRFMFCLLEWGFVGVIKKYTLRKILIYIFSENKKNINNRNLKAIQLTRFFFFFFFVFLKKMILFILYYFNFLRNKKKLFSLKCYFNFYFTY